MSVALLCIYATVVSGAILGGGGSLREKELARIQHYELIHFDVDGFTENSTLSFHAYGEDYTVVLFPKESLIAPDIRTHSKTCHYGGHVVQPAGLETTSYLALSNCPHRGIRGSLTIGDEKYFVKPSACFLDAELDRAGQHQATDEHLIYKVSDFDIEGLPHPHGVESTEFAQSVQKQIERQIPIPDPMVPGILHVELPGQNRRRLADQQCELYIIVDPSLVDEYKGMHPTDWYSELAQWVFDVINSVSEEYVYFGSQWPTAMGSIEVQMVRLEVIESWSGVYKSLEPPDWTSYSIDGLQYLYSQEDWVADNGRSGYDATHLMTVKPLTDSGGWGNVRCICGSSCMANDGSGSGDAWTTRTIAHELGHNFGAQHDGTARGVTNNECGNDDGIMGYGNGMNGWSYCTRDYWLDYYNDNNALTCLRSGFRTFVDNYGGDLGQLTPSPIVNSGLACYELSGFPDSSYNGEWAIGAQYNGYPYYTRGSLYLFVSAGGNTHIDYALHEYANAYCPGDDISECGAGTWRTIVGGSWAVDSDAEADECGSINLYPNPTSRPTPRPTPYPVYSYTPSPVSTGDDGDCVVMSGSNTDAWNGQWAYDGDFDGAPSYTRNNAFLFFSTTYKSYDIANSKGSQSYLGYCYTTSVTQCHAGGWYNDEDVSVSSSSCGEDTATQSCLRVTNLQSDLNGEWTDLGVSNNGHTVYQRANFYLFNVASGSASYWTVAAGDYFADSSTASHDFWNYGWCGYDDVTECDGVWNSYSGTASSSTFTDCNAFISSDLACLDDTATFSYADELCLSSALLWGESNATTQFAVSTEECLEDQPLFVSTDDAYHLHYSPYLQYTDDAELSARWVLSEGVVQQRGPAYCYQEDLGECVAGEWMVRASDADTSEYVADALMSYAECGEGAVGSDEVKESQQNDTAAMVALILAIAVVLAVIAGFVVYRRNKNNKVEVEFEEEEEDEIEIEFETEINTTTSTQ